MYKEDSLYLTHFPEMRKNLQVLRKQSNKKRILTWFKIEATRERNINLRQCSCQDQHPSCSSKNIQMYIVCSTRNRDRTKFGHASLHSEPVCLVRNDVTRFTLLYDNRVSYSVKWHLRIYQRRCKGKSNVIFFYFCHQGRLIE